jgi:hypothetical protein
MFFYLRNVQKAGMQRALDADRDEPIGRLGVPQAPQSYSDLLLLEPYDDAGAKATKSIGDERPLMFWDDA